LLKKSRNGLSLILACVVALCAVAVVGANAQVPHKAHRQPSGNPEATGGVETIKPQEGPTKDTGKSAGWKGTYIGVNAGAGFGATAGTNVVVPFGSQAKPEK